MVMEATPSPQSVGREFVRQYYTLLNKAPAHLHRFYNNTSSFVHGGLDAPNRESAPVIGQKQIHHRIQQLNFHDCHAKISQVDSQVTLGNGVVVQVTGELSNGGAPMRRFTQTFVLASQSPKKYYVHNDIFRYQDYIIPDEDGDGGESGRSEEEEESAQHTTSAAVVNPTPVTMVAAAPVASSALAFYPHQPLPPPAFAQPAAVEPQVATAIPAGPAPAAVPLAPPTLNGHPPHTADDVLVPQTLQVSLATPLGDAPPEPAEIEEVPSPEEEIIPDSSSSASAIAGQLEQVPAVPPEPKTYANLLKSGGQAAFSQPPHNAQSYNPPQYQSLPATRPYQSQPAQIPAMSNRSSTGEPTSPNASAAQNTTAVSPGSQPQAQRPRPPRPPRQEHQQHPVNNAPVVSDGGNTVNSVTGGSGGSSSRRYSDSQQIFLGNLPHSATEEELRAMFGRFGTIAELRVHSKAGVGIGGGPPGSRVPPNYGFITYEDPQSVQNCFNARPLFFPPGSTEGQKLNVEEKKTRPRGGGGPGGDGGAPRGPRASRPPFTRGPHPHQAYRR